MKSSLLWARSPRVFLGLSFFYGTIDRKSSPLSPQLRSLVSVKVALQLQCPFCVDINSAVFRKRKGSKDQLKELESYQTSPLFDGKEKAALAYAEAMSTTPNSVTDEIFENLKNEYSEDEIIELTALIAFQNCSSRFNTALKVPSQRFLK